ncbi:unnamed protein product [Heterobilharzia americana]|nr:unnamed protein product [Heterobilharzia americana]
MSNKHGGVTCNGCSRRDFRFRRYKCLVCQDYDLCGTCFDNQQETDKHSSAHPMQCLLTKADHDVFYCGESSTKQCVQSFTCSVCGQLGFTESSLSNHVFSHHPNAGNSEVLCPFCAVQTEGDPNRTTHDIAGHFKSVHSLSPSGNNSKSPEPLNVTSHSSIPGSFIHRGSSANQKSSNTASLSTRTTNQPRVHDVGIDKPVNRNCTTTLHNRLVVDSSCHNQNTENMNRITSQLISSNSRFTPGSIVAMKNYLKALKRNDKKYNSDTINNGLSNEQQQAKEFTDDDNQEADQNSINTHLDLSGKGTDSQSTVDKSYHTGAMLSHDSNNQESVVESQCNLPTDCATTSSGNQESKSDETCISPSPLENANANDQADIPITDSNRYLESLTSEMLDHKLNSLFPNPSKCTKSASGDPHLKSGNDDKSKDANKKLIFNSHANDHQSELPTNIQDEWDINWHMFLNELIWSSLCSVETPSRIS